MIFLGRSTNKEQFLLIYSFMRLDIITLQMKCRWLYIYPRHLPESLLAYLSVIRIHSSQVPVRVHEELIKARGGGFLYV